jgi:hypothetical protein
MNRTHNIEPKTADRQGLHCRRDIVWNKVAERPSRRLPPTGTQAPAGGSLAGRGRQGSMVGGNSLEHCAVIDGTAWESPAADFVTHRQPSSKCRWALGLQAAHLHRPATSVSVLQWNGLSARTATKARHPSRSSITGALYAQGSCQCQFNSGSGAPTMSSFKA